MMVKFLAIILIFLSGCKKISEYKRNGHKVTIVPNQIQASGELAKWRVGPLRRQEVSKGIRVKVELPQLEKENLKDLVDTMGIDSWLIRVKRRTMVTSSTLDHLMIPLVVPGQDKNSFRIKQISAGFINIYYSAAAISTRFEKFPCPAFDHRKYVTDFEIVDVQGREKSIRGNKRLPNYFSGKLSKYEYRPYPINAGSDLVGEYQFDIALFNSKEKLRKSNWFSLHQALKVNKEKSLTAIKGCKDFKIPNNDSTNDSIDDFKFGR